MEARLEALWLHIRRAAYGVLIGATLATCAADLGFVGADVKRTGIDVALAAIAVWIAMRLPLTRR